MAAGVVLVFGLSAALVQGRSSAHADRIRCADNLRSFGQIAKLYRNESGNHLPVDFSRMLEYGRQVRQRHDAALCGSIPVAPRARDRFVAMFDCPAGGRLLGEIEASGGSSTAADYLFLGGAIDAGTIAANPVIAYEPLDNHDGKGAHFLRVDGSVEWLDREQARRLIAEVKDEPTPRKLGKPGGF